ncbi:hypothetical protein SHD_3414 [Shewanella decolorationis S12]|uniref:Uncharacterized protein n=1 Tax=Shewanella decolorationis S12 TaxID=1353536 RepID=A0ABN0PGV9_9GAMM|nr:hypothetical protein SHD_3414 [Shewanella decolorationis S12]
MGENIFQRMGISAIKQPDDLPKIGCDNWVLQRKLSYDRHHLARHNYALLTVDARSLRWMARAQTILGILSASIFLKTAPDELNAVCCGGSI